MCYTIQIFNVVSRIIKILETFYSILNIVAAAASRRLAMANEQADGLGFLQTAHCHRIQFLNGSKRIP